MHFPVFLGAVEAGNHGGFAVRQQGGELFLGFLVIQLAVIVEDDAVGGVQETPAQIICHQQRAQVFPAAGAPVRVFAGGDSVFDFLQPGFDIHLQVEAAGDIQITVADFGKFVLEGFAFAGQGMALIQEIGDFFVIGEALARGTGDQIAPGGLKLQDTADFAELFIGGQRTASELGNDTL